MISQLERDYRQAFNEYKQKMNRLAKAEDLVSAHWDNVAELFYRSAKQWDETAELWYRVIELC